MRDELWMKHDARSRFDPKMAKFIFRHGMRGYGIFWAILEVLHYQNDHEIDMNTEFEGVAAQLNTEPDELQSVVESLVEIGLFKLEGTRLFQARLKQEQANRAVLRSATSASKSLAGRIGGIVSAAKKRGAKPKEIEALRSKLQAELQAPEAYALEERRGEESREESNLTNPKGKTTKQKYRVFNPEDFKFPPMFGQKAREAVEKWVHFKEAAGHPILLMSYQEQIDLYADRPKEYVAYVQRAISNQWQGFNEKIPLAAAPTQSNGVPMTNHQRNMAKLAELEAEEAAHGK